MRLTPLLILVFLLGSLPGLVAVFGHTGASCDPDGAPIPPPEVLPWSGPGLDAATGRTGASYDPNGAPAPPPEAASLGDAGLDQVTGRTGAEMDPDGAPPPPPVIWQGSPARLEGGR